MPIQILQSKSAFSFSEIYAFNYTEQNWHLRGITELLPFFRNWYPFKLKILFSFWHCPVLIQFEYKYQIDFNFSFYSIRYAYLYNIYVKARLQFFLCSSLYFHCLNCFNKKYGTNIQHYKHQKSYTASSIHPLLSSIPLYKYIQYKLDNHSFSKINNLLTMHVWLPTCTCIKLFH